MGNAGLDEAQTGIKIARRNISNLRYADDTTLMVESEELKTLLMTPRNIGKTLSDINHSRILYDPPPRILQTTAKINK